MCSASGKGGRNSDTGVSEVTGFNRLIFLIKSLPRICHIYISCAIYRYSGRIVKRSIIAHAIS